MNVVIGMDIKEKKLEIIFENNFDCYAYVDKNNSCLPNWYNDEDTMAMTKEKFLEVVSKLLNEKK